MPVKTRDELLGTLASGRLDDLKGSREAQWVDFKDQPYLLSNPGSVWEWCKDVAASANGGGGCIVVGVRTEAAVDTREDVAADYALVPKKLVNFDQHYKLLREYLTPEPRGLRMEWFPPEGEAGLLLIDIPVQDERDLPIVVRRAVEPGQKGATAVAVPTRVGPDTAWHTAERLHRVLNDDRLRGGTGESQREWEQIHRSRMDARIEEAERECGWENVPTLFLQGAPSKAGGLLAGMHESSGIKGALERPRLIRSSGFVPYAGTVEARDSGLASVSGDKAIWIEKDGLITAGGVVTDDWFARNPNVRSNGTAHHVNPLVLCEYALELFRFVYQELVPRAPTGSWTFRVVGRGLKTRGSTFLAGGDHRQLFRMHNGVVASGDQIMECFTGSGDPAKDALKAVTTVYAHYGLPPSVIPFSTDDGISEEMLKVL